jgi:hypothetical protein
VGGACGTYGGEERRGAYTFFLVGKSEGRRPLGRPSRRWEDNIKMYLKAIVWEDDWIDLSQDRDKWWDFVNTVMNLWYL